MFLLKEEMSVHYVTSFYQTHQVIYYVTRLAQFVNETFKMNVSQNTASGYKKHF